MSSLTQKSAPESGRTRGPSLSTSFDGGPSPIDCGNCGASWNGVFVHGAWLNAHGTLLVQVEPADGQARRCRCDRRSNRRESRASVALTGSCPLCVGNAGVSVKARLPRFGLIDGMIASPQ